MDLRNILITLSVLATFQVAMVLSCVSEPPSKCGSKNTTTPSKPIKACIKTPFSTKPVTTDDIAKDSPLIAFYLGKNNVSEGLDSECCTVFKLTEAKYIFFYVSTKHCGKYYIQVFLFSQAPEGPGSFLFTGLSGQNASVPLLVNGYTVSVNDAGCYKVVNAVTKLVAEGCNAEPNVFNTGITFSSNTQPDCCVLEESRKILESYLGKGSVISVPRRYPNKCVASFQGQPVINADRLYNNPDIEPICYP